MSLSILLVEDEPTIRRWLRGVLERHGDRVWEASSAIEAVDLIDRIPFDLAIIDYELGTILTGLDVAHQTKLGTERFLITGHDPSVTRPRVEDRLALFRLILPKPINVAHLIIGVERVEKSKEETKP